MIMCTDTVYQCMAWSQVSCIYLFSTDVRRHEMLSEVRITGNWTAPVYY